MDLPNELHNKIMSHLNINEKINYYLAFGLKPPPKLYYDRVIKEFKKISISDNVFCCEECKNKYLFCKCVCDLNIWFNYLHTLNDTITEQRYNGIRPVRDEVFMRLAISENLKLKNGPFV